jgi:hypothetical protein
MDAFADLYLGIVGEEAIGSTMLTDKIFKSGRHLGYGTSHAIGNHLGASLSGI